MLASKHSLWKKETYTLKALSEKKLYLQYETTLSQTVNETHLSKLKHTRTFVSYFIKSSNSILRVWKYNLRDFRSNLILLCLLRRDILR